MQCLSSLLWKKGRSSLMTCQVSLAWLGTRADLLTQTPRGALNIARLILASDSSALIGLQSSWMAIVLMRS